MKKYFRAFMMCMTMFCAIPCPFHDWDDESRPLMTLFLPFVGLWIGCLWALSSYVMRLLGVPALLAGAVLAAFPVIVTGGMHMDGFLDVSDAVRSWRDVTERRRILKDPHVGSFAVVDTVILLMIQFAAFASVKDETVPYSLILIPTVSRCAAALAVTLLRPISESEYSGAYRKGIKTSHIVFLAAVSVLTVALGFVLLGRYGFVSVAVIAGYLLYMRRAFRSLDGMSGDVSGYALTFGELCGIIVYALL